MQRKTIVAVYDNHQEAKEATEALYQDGFTSEQVSLVASDHKREYYREDTVHEGGETAAGRAGSWAVTGGLFGGIAGLVAGLVGLTLPGVGPVIVAGPLGAMLGGAITGAIAGGLLGALTGLGIPEEEAHVYAEGLRRGSNLVSVTIPGERVDAAMAVMNRYNPVDIDERSAAWRKEGWSRFDDKAHPYTPAADATVTGAGLPAGGGGVVTSTSSTSATTQPMRARSYSYPDSAV